MISRYDTACGASELRYSHLTFFWVLLLGHDGHNDTLRDIHWSWSRHALECPDRSHLQVRSHSKNSPQRFFDIVLPSRRASHDGSRSYEKATASSTRLFGRARVNFSAQNEALEIFLDPGRHPQEAFHRVASPKMFLSRLFKIFRLCTLVAILATASNTAIFLVSQSIRVLNAKRGDVINSSGFTASISKILFHLWPMP